MPRIASSENLLSTFQTLKETTVKTVVWRINDLHKKGGQQKILFSPSIPSMMKTNPDLMVTGVGVDGKPVFDKQVNADWENLSVTSLIKVLEQIEQK